MDTSSLSKRLKDSFPELLDWNPTDEEYTLVDGLNSFQTLVNQFPSRPWKKNVNECEEIARRFMYQVRDWEYNKAIGVAFVTMHQGIEERHTLNIAFSYNDILLADLQTGNVWIANPSQDNIYFVEM